MHNQNMSNCPLTVLTMQIIIIVLEITFLLEILVIFFFKKLN